MSEEKVRKMVREGYGKIAKAERCGCGCGSDVSQQVGYSCCELNAVPEGADLGLGCGNPVALASLKEGETVVDLGSGAGLDFDGFTQYAYVADNGALDVNQASTDFCLSGWAKVNNDGRYG